MARQVLSERRTRWYARKTGLPIQRMLARGGARHWIMFRTADDRHGDVHADGSFEVRWATFPDPHWTSCPGQRDYDGWAAWDLNPEPPD
jgi:hypothetical protein